MPSKVRGNAQPGRIQSTDRKVILMKWKDIEGYEGLYQVSDEGLVRSCDRRTGGRKHRLVKGIILKQTRCYSNGNYRKVSLSSNGISKQCRVHQLVAKAFLPNPNKLIEVNHKDFNPNNNHVSNLEWCNHADNIHYSAMRGRYRGINKKFDANTRQKIIKEYVPYSRKASARALSEKYGCDIVTIYNILKSNSEGNI